jgi:hypothetical protein
VVSGRNRNACSAPELHDENGCKAGRSQHAYERGRDDEPPPACAAARLLDQGLELFVRRLRARWGFDDGHFEMKLV